MKMNGIFIRKITFSNLFCNDVSVDSLDWSLRGHIKFDADEIVVSIELMGDTETPSIQIDILVEGVFTKNVDQEDVDSSELEEIVIPKIIPVLQSCIDGLFVQTKLPCLNGVNVSSLKYSFI